MATDPRFPRPSQAVDPLEPANSERADSGPGRRVKSLQFIGSPEIVMMDDLLGTAAERFQRLATAIIARPEPLVQTLIVSSAGPAEGKSLIAVNLAMALSRGGANRVLLMDADLRAPRVHRFLTARPKEGLMDILTGKSTLERCLYDMGRELPSVLTAGAAVSNPIPLLSAPAFRSLLESLRRQFDRIVIDSPPAVPFADVDLLASHCDGALIVVRANSTPTAMVSAAEESITTCPILGIVLTDWVPNLADRGQSYADEYYEYYRRRGSE